MQLLSRWFVLLPLVIVSTASCAMIPRSRLIQRGFAPLTAQLSHVARPALNTESVAQVGDTMIEAGSVYTRPAIRVMKPVTHIGTSLDTYSIQIPAGVLIGSGSATGPVRGTFFEVSPYLLFQRYVGGPIPVKGGVFVPDSEDAPPEIYWHATDSGVPLVDPNREIRFERTVNEEWRGDSFRRELVYSGRSGGTIKLLYREFIEQRIRPAFSQELSYDLALGETIGFRGARFRVVDADNVQIKYVVLHQLD